MTTLSPLRMRMHPATRNSIKFNDIELRFDLSNVQVLRYLGLDLRLCIGKLHVSTAWSAPKDRNYRFQFRGNTHCLDGFADFFVRQSPVADGKIERIVYKFTAIATKRPPTDLHLLYHELTIRERVQNEVWEVHQKRDHYEYENEDENRDENLHLHPPT